MPIQAVNPWRREINRICLELGITRKQFRKRTKRYSKNPIKLPTATELIERMDGEVLSKFEQERRLRDNLMS